MIRSEIIHKGYKISVSIKGFQNGSPNITSDKHHKLNPIDDNCSNDVSRDRLIS